MLLELIGIIEPKSEDNGLALIAEIDYEVIPRGWKGENFFIRLQSWSESKTHHVMNALNGKKVKITIETIDGVNAG